MSVQQRYYVYVLKSLKDKKLYVGFTKNLPARVEAHNMAWFRPPEADCPWNLSTGRAASTRRMQRVEKNT